MATYDLTIPVSDAQIEKLRVGDQVRLTGIIVTARDAAHKYMIETFIRRQGPVPERERELYADLKRWLKGSFIYHCGPVVRQDENGKWHFVAAGPTTSIREEPYQAEVIEHFGLKGVIGKGGMAGKTLQACRDHKAVYLHAVGGAASLIADSVKEVVTVEKLVFGVPEAFWVIRVENFPAVVTMDGHGSSIHAEVEAKSKEKLNELLGR
jgi:tartrate/fumarate subfamily iron-sulfur-dependent hydro-lyase beta chain